MTDVILSSFISLFALFGKEEQVDEQRAKDMLVSYLRRHLGIRNTDLYLDLYSDMRMAYEMTDDLNTQDTVSGICSNLHGKIRTSEEALLLLRLMEFCGYDGIQTVDMFDTMAAHFHISKSQYQSFYDFVNSQETVFVKLHRLEGFEGVLKTLYDTETGLLLFSYDGNDKVLLNDIPILPRAYQVWLQSSVLKGSDGRPVYYSSIYSEYNKEQDTAQAVEFCGRDINFRFPNSDNGMHNLSFTLRNGELLAIMGGSGTGKTTLLSLLNGSLTPQEGTITINGHNINEPRAKALIGFVPQDDLLVEELTVWQNLLYTARFCFEGMSEKDIAQRITQVLKDLDLYQVKDLVVGSPLNKTISGGQRKRLNIALELLREPAVLFLDEPTSGLSSADTERVILLLKEQTQKGRLVIANIHQPSSDVYKLFDRLWLLDKGGYPVYDGNPIDAITTFKTAANYADAQISMCPSCGAVNPEVVLNIIDEKALSKSGKETDRRKVSPQEWHEMYLTRRGDLEEVREEALPPNEQHRPSLLRQFWIFLDRDLHCKATNLQYLLITLLEAPLLALVCAGLTHYAPETGYTLMENKNFVSFLFMAVIVATFIGMSGSAEEIIRDKSLLKREKFLRLSYGSYIWSKVCYSVMVSAVQTGLFVLAGAWVMGLSGTLGVWWLVLFVTAFLARLTGLLLSQWLNSVVSIYISIPILLIPQILLCGLVVSFSDLTPRSTTGNVPVIGDMIPSRWAFEALAVTQFSDNPYEAPLFEVQRERYRWQYEQWGVIYTLKSEVETMKDEQERGKPVDPAHLRVVHNELPRLEALCGVEPYSGDDSYGSLRGHLLKLEDVVKKHSNRWTLLEDRIVNDRLKEMGREALRLLKRDHHNTALQDFVTGADQKELSHVIDGHIVARAGAVWLMPKSVWGRAPFYSSEKRLGGFTVSTLVFNMGMLCLFSCLGIVLLLLNIPDKIRKNKY